MERLRLTLLYSGLLLAAGSIATLRPISGSSTATPCGAKTAEGGCLDGACGGIAAAP